MVLQDVSAEDAAALPTARRTLFGGAARHGDDASCASTPRARASPRVGVVVAEPGTGMPACRVREAPDGWRLAIAPPRRARPAHPPGREVATRSRTSWLARSGARCRARPRRRSRRCVSAWWPAPWTAPQPRRAGSPARSHFSPGARGGALCSGATSRTSCASRRPKGWTSSRSRCTRSS